MERIPAGKVATYGQIAGLAGFPDHAREVGYALAGLPEESALPWQRVINARGEVSPRREPGRDAYQRHLLEEEGVTFGRTGRIDLERFGWDPAKRSRARARADAPGPAPGDAQERRES